MEIVGIDFFQAGVDKTSGACRPSEKPSIVHNTNSDEDSGDNEKKKRAMVAVEDTTGS